MTGKNKSERNTLNEWLCKKKFKKIIIMGSTEGGGLRRGYLPDANVGLTHFPGVFTWMKKTSCSLKWGRKSHNLSLWSFSVILMYVFGNILQLPNPQFCRLPPSQHACIPSFDEFKDEFAQLVSVSRQREVSSKLGSVGTENQINFVSVAITIIVFGDGKRKQSALYRSPI